MALTNKKIEWEEQQNGEVVGTNGEGVVARIRLWNPKDGATISLQIFSDEILSHKDLKELAEQMSTMVEDL